MINTHNEWDKLVEVIVGDGFPSTLPALELSFQMFFHDNIHGEEWGYNHHVKKKHVEEMKDDVEGFVTLLRSNGISVKRPKVPKQIESVKTPYWESTNFHPLNVRDQTLLVGDTIIETPPNTRYRYFENDYMKHLFMWYHNMGAKWIVAPRPMILDSSFDLNYVLKNADERTKKYYLDIKENSKTEMSMGYEIMFDGANCMRFGKDILMNCSTQNHYYGRQWLQSVLPDYKIWPIELVDSHIDSTFVPLKPGLLLVDPKKFKIYDKSKFPKGFDKWDIVEAPASVAPEEYDNEDMLLASRSIDINVLSIDQNTIICHDRYYDQLQPLLKPYNIECIPCRLRHSRIFAGAFHCLTLDTIRESKYEEYFE